MIAHASTRFPIGLASHVGMRMSAFSTAAGRVLLGLLPGDELDARLKAARLKGNTKVHPDPQSQAASDHRPRPCGRLLQHQAGSSDRVLRGCRAAVPRRRQHHRRDPKHSSACRACRRQSRHPEHLPRGPARTGPDFGLATHLRRSRVTQNHVIALLAIAMMRRHFSNACLRLCASSRRHSLYNRTKVRSAYDYEEDGPMLSMDSNDILTRVGPGTPMGELMREYWIPACLPSGAGARRRRRRG